MTLIICGATEVRDSAWKNWQQVFEDGDGPIDWGNFEGFFDEYDDTQMIMMGYYMTLIRNK